MKKALWIIVIVALTLSTAAFASPCKLPYSNTDAEIFFSGFEWYSDYDKVKGIAAEKGIDNTWSLDSFERDMCTTPHWKTLLTDLHSFAESETNCGGYITYTSSCNVPKVGGYNVDTLKMFFMWNPSAGYTDNYKKNGAVQFYMAKYELSVSDTKACYEDLVSKLKTKYGNLPISGIDDSYSPTYYTVWVNQEGALVGVSYDEYNTQLVYMAPGAEDKLNEVEAWVAQSEIESASGDMSGL